MADVYDIRTLEVTDLPLVLSWRNHPDVRRNMITQHEITSTEHRNWFLHAQQDVSRRLLIAQDNDTPIGYIQFSNITAAGVCDWGFYSHPGAPKGTGRKMGVAALNHAFVDLGLHKVCGQALAFNNNSIKFHQRLGFMQEGILRDQHLIDGIYHHLICFGLLSEEWQFEVRGETQHD